MRDTSIIFNNTSRQIRSSKRDVTILFTDIEESTKYWDKFGDVEGRLMVDRHNRLLFPIVPKFKGKIIKTIGDSIMAAFVNPENAIKAAIAMQQTMAMERQGDDTFRIRIRIGIHTGEAIVEKGDVYGDIVNVASRIERISKANQIFISQTTVKKIDDEYAFIFKKKGRFVPKGKEVKLIVYSCDWKNHPLLTDKILKSSHLPVNRQIRFEVSLYLAGILGIMYFIYLKYLRYLLSDSENVALLYLNSTNIIENYPYYISGFFFIIVILLITILKLRLLPFTIMRMIKSGFIFSIGFFISYFFIQYLPIEHKAKWNEVLDSSRHLYVEVLEDNSNIYEKPNLRGNEIRQIHAGNLLLQTDYKKIGGLNWNKVLLGREQYGWIIRTSPPQMGIPEKKVSEAYKFYFRYKDLYVFLISVMCLIFSFWKFRVRPV